MRHGPTSATSGARRPCVRVERLDDAGGLELLRLPLLPNRGVAEPLGDGLLLTSRPRPIHPAGAGDQTAHKSRIGPGLVTTTFTAFPGVLPHLRTGLSLGVVTELASQARQRPPTSGLRTP